MNKHHECDTREHLLNTGEQLCLHRGFSAMGLSELLKTAGVPKGSFYHYFRSKEAFGVAMIQRYYQRSHADSQRLFSTPVSAPDRVLAWFQRTQESFCAAGMVTRCLTVKLSAEVCDLSEEMRESLNQGANQLIALLAATLKQGQQQGEVPAAVDVHALAMTLYSLWLGAHLQAKISRSVEPLHCALQYANCLLTGSGNCPQPTHSSDEV